MISTVIVKGAGRFVPSDAPDQFAAAIRNWYPQSGSLITREVHYISDYRMGSRSRSATAVIASTILATSVLDDAYSVYTRSGIVERRAMNQAIFDRLYV